MTAVGPALYAASARSRRPKRLNSCLRYFAPPTAFARGSPGSIRSAAAVWGISWNIPRAPALETACGSKRDSILARETSSPEGSPVAATACARIGLAVTGAGQSIGCAADRGTTRPGSLTSALDFRIASCSWAASRASDHTENASAAVTTTAAVRRRRARCLRTRDRRRARRSSTASDDSIPALEGARRGGVANRQPLGGGLRGSLIGVGGMRPSGWDGSGEFCSIGRIVGGLADVLGAVPLGSRSVEFTVWAPRARSVTVLGERLERLRQEEGMFSGCVAACPGTEYCFVLDDGHVWPDPCSRFQPRGVHGPSCVVDLAELEIRPGPSLAL